MFLLQMSHIELPASMFHSMTMVHEQNAQIFTWISMT